MPDVENGMLIEEPVEEVEEVETCERCEAPTDDCTCCSICDNTEEDCACSTCNGCGEQFRSEDSNSCCSEYCSHRCGERNNHYHCICGNVVGSTSRCCEGCGWYECCREFSCSICECCENCCACSQEDLGPIQSYHCRDYPRTDPVINAYAPPYLYIGAEVEGECRPDDDRAEVAQAIHDAHSDRLLLTEDGSLSNGFEMVTGKLALAVHQQIWPEIAKTCVKAGLRSWKHSTTGMHVHLSRDWFTPLSIGKLLVFINSEANRKHIVKIAGRRSADYAALTKKKFTDGRCDSPSRYEAVNLCNNMTIELRIFKGTLNADHILTNIEFAHAAAHYVSQCSMQDCENWAAFLSYLCSERKQYRHLLAFLHVTCPTENPIATEEE